MSTLYIVATPIGNLEDITHRALRVLAEVDWVACEDTRQTLKLMSHYGIKARLTPFHSYNLKKETPRLLGILAAGQSVALVTDGGTPGISDPGSYLVAMARERGITVSPVPGPSALSAMLSVAGFAGPAVSFAGFLSPKAGRRRRALQELLARPGGVVLYESPHRILKLLEDLRRPGSGAPLPAGPRDDQGARGVPGGPSGRTLDGTGRKGETIGRVHGVRAAR